MPLADTLLRLAHGTVLYEPFWSSQIIAEVNRTLSIKFGLSSASIEARERNMRRHVLAAAVEAQAEIVVTYNLRDFEPESLSPYNIKAMGPSSFLRILYERNPKAVLRTLHEQAESIRESTGFVLDRLEVNVPAFIASLRTQL